MLCYQYKGLKFGAKKLIARLVAFVGITSTSSMAVSVLLVVTTMTMAIRRLIVALVIMSVTAVRGNCLDGMRFDDVLDLLVTNGIVVITSVGGVEFTLGIVTVTGLLLAKVGVVVVVLHTPVKVVMRGVLSMKQSQLNVQVKEEEDNK